MLVWGGAAQYRRASGLIRVWVWLLARQAVGRGGMASGMVGDAPDAGSPRGEDQRGSISTSTSTSTTTISPPRPLIRACHASRTTVVSSPELLEHVLSFLAGGKVEAREDLGRAALVCRSWRDAAVGEELWGRVASEVMPAMGRRVSEVGARRCVLERSHCHRDQRAWVGDAWWYALRLQVEVWDTLDETCLLSTEGRMGVTDHPYAFRLAGTDRVEVVCPAFSAASKDPVQRRLASIDDYFRRPEGTVQESIMVRVYVRDEVRGRQAMLWNTFYRGGELQCEDVSPDHPVRPHLPEGSRRVEQADDMYLYSTALPGEALRACVGLYVRPEAGQEGVAEADKVWRLGGQLRRPRCVLLHSVPRGRDRSPARLPLEEPAPPLTAWARFSHLPKTSSVKVETIQLDRQPRRG
jgi:hypothetical protein